MIQSDTNDTIKKADGREEKRLARFIKALEDCANISQACSKARVSRSMVYRRRDTNPDFAQAWDDSLEIAVDSLEAEAWRRAREGRDEVIYRDGVAVGTISKYSDTLMIFLLKSNRPKKYRETIRHENTGADGGPMEIKAVDYRNGLASLAPRPIPDSDTPS